MTVCDINAKNIELLSGKSITVVSPEEIYDSNYNVISPCALGGTVNINSLEKINCEIIAGAANNQLEDDELVPDILQKKNILYIPDFLINAGGIISVYHEQINDIDHKKVMDMTELIYDKVNSVLKHSEDNSLTTNASAIRLAKDRIKENSKSSYICISFLNLKHMINRRSLRVKVLQLLFSYYNQISFRKDNGDAQLQISNQLEESICGIEKGYYDIFTLCIIFKEINEEKRVISKSELIKKVHQDLTYQIIELLILFKKTLKL